MISSKLRGLACAASLLAAATLSAYVQPSVVASTVPANGDVNLYGVARVLRSVPILRGVATLWGSMGARSAAFFPS
jgi:hypothetical protein